MRTRSRTYPELAKLGFLLGLGLFVVGAGGEVVGHALYDTLPAWEDTLFTDSILFGILTAFFSLAVFGVVLPLIE
ncbi:hypothetical protein [Haloarchaeobius sp. TZWSO28]|uniref:DUF7860 family protein n=1 Tax=unclassified Haloarchaeobius TaxID=2614452 RepID=UPI003EB6AA1A